MRYRAVFVMAIILACVGRPAACQTNTKLDEDLQHSEMCAKAAKDFRERPDWSNPNEDYTFTSHFNQRMGRCLVKVTSSDVASGTITESQHVYDALEGTVLGGEIITKEMQHGPNPVTTGFLMVRDGKILGKDDLDEARRAYFWFQTLMDE